MMTEQMPAVLTLDADGHFASISMPPSAVEPFRNLQEVAFFSTSMVRSNLRTQRSHFLSLQAQTGVNGAANRGLNVLDRLSAWLTNLSFDPLRGSSGETADVSCPIDGLPGLSYQSEQHSMVLYDSPTGYMCSMTNIRGQAASLLACVEVALLETCPSTRPLVGTEGHQLRRGRFQRHHVSLSCSSPTMRRVVDGDLLDLLLTLPRGMQQLVFETAWQRFLDMQSKMAKTAQVLTASHSQNPTYLIPEDFTCWSSHDPFQSEETRRGLEQRDGGKHLPIPPVAEWGLLLLVQQALSLHMV